MEESSSRFLVIEWILTQFFENLNETPHNGHFFSFSFFLLRKKDQVLAEIIDKDLEFRASERVIGLIFRIHRGFWIKRTHLGLCLSVKKIKD